MVHQLALNFPLDVERKLARAEPGEIHAVAAAQPPDLSFVVGPLERETAAVIDEAVPDVDVGNACLFCPAAVDLIEIGGIGAPLRAALGRQPDPDDWNARALQRSEGRIHALDVGDLPFLAVVFDGVPDRATLVRR